MYTMVGIACAHEKGRWIVFTSSIGLHGVAAYVW
jgi:hypothetical protein